VIGTVGRSDATEPNLTFHRDIDPVRMMRARFADPQAGAIHHDAARVIGAEKNPVESALFALKVSGTIPPRHLLVRGFIRSPCRRAAEMTLGF
jgi:hypothetical protein